VLGPSRLAGARLVHSKRGSPPMSTPRLDSSAHERLHHLASSLRLSAQDAEEALFVKNGDTKAAEQFLRSLTMARRPALSREERVTKCAFQLAKTPDALDILHASLARVLASPHAEKLRKVNVTGGAFVDRVASKNKAGVELLYAVGYEPMHGHLVLQKHEPALLRLALTQLEEARKLSNYVEGAAARAGEQARRQASAQDAAAAAARRAAFLAKVPTEPSEDEASGRASTACVISVRLGGRPGLPHEFPRVGTRRFDSDNTLDDLINFIRSLPDVPEAEHLNIENVTTRPYRKLESATQGSLSLFALDLWPRGQVVVSA